MEERYKTLVEKVLAGDTAQFRHIVNDFEKRIYYFFLRMTHNADDSSDLTQNTFIRSFSYLKSYNSRYGFKSWIYSIAHNQLRDWWSRQKKGNCSMEELEETYFCQFCTGQKIEDEVCEKDFYEMVQKAIAGLPDLYREIMLLLVIEECSYEDISRITGVPVNTVKIRIHRARRLLKNALEKWL